MGREQSRQLAQATSGQLSWGARLARVLIVVTSSQATPQPRHPDRSVAKPAKWRDLLFRPLMHALSANRRALPGRTGEDTCPYATSGRLLSRAKFQCTVSPWATSNSPPSLTEFTSSMAEACSV